MSGNLYLDLSRQCTNCIVQTYAGRSHIHAKIPICDWRGEF